jgi:hypothetical protein
MLRPRFLTIMSFAYMMRILVDCGTALEEIDAAIRITDACTYARKDLRPRSVGAKSIRALESVYSIKRGASGTIIHSVVIS